MPFTAAHPAIIIPLLRRRWLSATALVMGSMAPDFEYFFRLKTQSQISHTLPGLLVFNLPVALLLCLLFHTVVRDQAIRYLPPYFKNRALAVTYPDNWLQHLRNNWLVISFSALIGAFSHLFWDSFTHRWAFFVELIPLLRTSVELPLLGQEMALHRVVQHVSTAVGLALILWYIHLLPAVQGQQAEQKNWFGFWFGIFAAGLLFLLFNLALRHGLAYAPPYMIATVISGWMLALFISALASLLWQQLETKKG